MLEEEEDLQVNQEVSSFEESVQDFTSRGYIKATTNYKKTVYELSQARSAEKLINGTEKEFKKDRYINKSVDLELEEFKTDIEKKFYLSTVKNFLFPRKELKLKTIYKTSDYST